MRRRTTNITTMPRLKSIDTSVFIIRILLSCIGMSQALSAYAQDGIRGRVLDEQGKGLDAAVVMLASLPDNVLMETTITDSNGQYLFPVHNGKFLLCIKTLGHHPCRISDASGHSFGTGGDFIERCRSHRAEITSDDDFREWKDTYSCRAILPYRRRERLGRVEAFPRHFRKQ